MSDVRPQDLDTLSIEKIRSLDRSVTEPLVRRLLERVGTAGSSMGGSAPVGGGFGYSSVSPRHEGVGPGRDGTDVSGDRPGTTRPHRVALSGLSLDDVHRLGAGDDSAFALVSASRWGCRVLLLDEVVRLLHAHLGAGGLLPPPDEAWDELTRLHDRARDAVRSTLLYPQVGRWLGVLVRRLSDTAADTAAPPLWLDAGHLWSLVAAATAKAGLDTDVPVPVRDGAVVLPGVGVAVFPTTVSGAAVFRLGAEVRFEDLTVRVPEEFTEATQGWHPLPVLTAPRAEAALDTHDPFRGTDPALPRRPPAPVAPQEVERWNELWRQAWAVLVDNAPGKAAVLGAALTAVLPWQDRGEGGFTSMTREDAFGAVVLASPADPVALAEVLVHEFHHTKLSGLLDLLDLVEPRHRYGGALFYTAWRDDPRPLPGALHGVCAFAAVTGFWRDLVRRAPTPRACFEFAYWRRQALDVATVIRSRTELTEAGRVFVDGVLSAMADLEDEEVPSAVAERALEAVIDHRVEWRLAHVRPTEEVVKALTGSWLAGGRARDAAWYYWPRYATGRLDGRLGFIRAACTGAAGAMPTPAQRAYLAGDLAEARRLSLDAITDPDERHGWVVLGLVARLAGDDLTTRGLLSRPELVRAVSAAVRRETDRGVEVEELAAWLAAPHGPVLPPVQVGERERQVAR